MAACKKAGPPGGIGSPEYKAAQEATNKHMAGGLDALAGAVPREKIQAAILNRVKRGRPVTTGTTPAKVRKATSRAAATQEGGKRLHVMLTPEGAQHLQQIMDDNDVGQTRAVHIALDRGR